MNKFQYEPLRAPVHQPDAEMIHLIEVEDSDWVTRFLTVISAISH